MFYTNDTYLAWLEEHADPIVAELVAAQPGRTQAALREVFERYGTVPAPADLMTLARGMGLAVVEIVKLALRFEARGDVDADQPHAFAIACSLALFRLIDRGPQGDAHHLSAPSADGMPQFFQSAEEWEAGFAMPLVQQAVSQSLRTLTDAKRAAPPPQLPSLAVGGERGQVVYRNRVQRKGT